MDTRELFSKLHLQVGRVALDQDTPPGELERFHRSLAEQVDWLKNFPIADLKRRGCIPSSAKGVDLLREVLQFFRVAAPALPRPCNRLSRTCGR